VCVFVKVFVSVEGVFKLGGYQQKPKTSTLRSLSTWAICSCSATTVAMLSLTVATTIE